MNHGQHTTRATLPKGEHGDTATVAGIAMRCVLLSSGAMWLPTYLSHMTHVSDGQ